MDKRLACCLLAGRCIAMSNACTREVLPSCGVLAAYRESLLPVPFCVSSVGCEYSRYCTPESVKKFGCAQIDEAESKGMSVTGILMSKIKNDGGWDIEGPWFDALRSLAGGDGQFEIAQKAVQVSIVAKKFGIRANNGRALEDPSLSDDFLSRLEQA